MRIDRMELADIGNRRKMAEGVLKLLPEVVFPLPVEEIALALDIRKIDPFETDSFEGALLTNEAKSNSTILVREGVQPERRRFTVGHELGHYLMPLHIPDGDGFRCSAADMRKEEQPASRGRPAWEAEANAFALELLMPAKDFNRRLTSARGASIEVIVSLAHDFGVSKLACGYRLMRLSDSPCAMLISNDGVIKQVYRHSELPFISLKVGMGMPRDGLAMRLKEGPGSISDIEPTEQCGWCSREKSGVDLYEQVLTQSDGWRLTLLTAETTDDHDDDEN